MVLPSETATTTMTMGATNTSTAAPSVFTGAAATNNALAGCAVAGALAAMGLNFL
jgi:hypothetical protein